MLDRVGQMDAPSLRLQLHTTNGRIAKATGPDDLERALRDYVTISLQLHDRLSAPVRTRMRDSLRRTAPQRGFMYGLSALVEGVYGHTTGASKA